MALRRTTANRDEYCDTCGYPFDTGESVVQDADDRIYCSKRCARDYAQAAKWAPIPDGEAVQPC